MKILNKEEWLSEMPELIHNLKLNYNFYFSGFYTKIKKDILEIVKNPKNKHKISIYNKDNRFWLVVYRKGTPDIYYTAEYKKDTNNNHITNLIWDTAKNIRARRKGAINQHGFRKKEKFGLEALYEDTK